MSNPQRLAQLQKLEKSEQLFFQPRRTNRDYVEAVDSRNGYALNLHIRYQELASLRSKIVSAQREYQQARIDAQAASFFGWKTSKHLIRKVRNQRREELQRLRQSYFQVRRLYLAELKQFNTLYPHGYSNTNRWYQGHQQVQTIRP